MNKKTIFVVDDSLTELTVLKGLLSNNYNIITLNSAMKMFAKFEDVIPDLILLDVSMPTISGNEAIDKLKANPAWARIPFIFVTGWKDEKMIEHCMKLGAVCVINKPFNQAYLLECVEKGLRRSSSWGTR